MWLIFLCSCSTPATSHFVPRRWKFHFVHSMTINNSIWALPSDSLWDKRDWVVFFVTPPLCQVTTPCVFSPWTGCWCSSSRTATPSAGSSLVSCCPAHWSTTPEQTASSLFPLHASWRATSRLFNKKINSITTIACHAHLTKIFVNN